MASLARDLRKDLSNKVRDARRIAEDGARKVVESLAVQNHEPWGSMTPEERKLRNRLRAHGRQLGDQLDTKRSTQSIDRLVAEVAYEQWHIMLFARFLAENELLLMPDTTTAITLDEVEEIARDQRRDWLTVVTEFAERMLPQIFRPGDPALDVTLPRETRKQLEDIIRGLDVEVFTATDSLGWVYQFWQADQKDAVNSSGIKIGATELPSVTQLFTEDYMVDFLLDNTLGAWHAGRILSTHPTLAEGARNEAEVREAVALPGCEWKFLRIIKTDGRWIPAAGNFEHWPKSAKKLRCLDPCMGSGHFVVAMFDRLVALRLADEQTDEVTTVAAVISDNIFGLEIDNRCTQIAAFNLALAAWRRVKHCVLPPLNLACSGVSPNVKRDEWAKLAGDDTRLKRGMERLHDLFGDAPLLGSLINPRGEGGDLLEAEFHELQPLLDRVLALEGDDDSLREMTVAARGLAKAAEILVGEFHLVATNVPYLGRGNQNDALMAFSERSHPDAKADLATCFIERCLSFCGQNGSTALVAPQNWLFLTSYGKFRSSLLKGATWDIVAKLGSRAFETIGGEVVNVVLVGLSARTPSAQHMLTGMDVSTEKAPSEKASSLSSRALLQLRQKDQVSNPDARIVLTPLSQIPLLSAVADASHGQGSFDSPRFSIAFWEVNGIRDGWVTQQSTPAAIQEYGGCHFLFRWENGVGALAQLMESKQEQGYSSGKWKAGVSEWGKLGVLVGQMGEIPCTRYLGSSFDENASVIIPHDPALLPALWEFCSSDNFRSALKEIDQSIKITCKTLVKVPFDRKHWQAIAASKKGAHTPKPFSSDATQWLFDGHPRHADQPLQVAVARLVGYRWPRQNGADLADCPVLHDDGLEAFADEDGVVCLSSLRGEPPADERLRELLSKAWGSSWRASVLGDLLERSGYAGKTLDDWLRNGFFEQHCTVFHSRPFIWHVWDGRHDGFQALVNYHRLAASNEEGRRTLEKLIYTYLGAWIERQEKGQAAGLDGADGRLAAALHLKGELEKILEGQPPFDIFVRWKPLEEQPKGWNPDINDGVRINIRPLMMARPLGAKAKSACVLRHTPRIGWDKDRGKEPRRPKEAFPWLWTWDGSTGDFSGNGDFDGARWNDLHYSLAAKSKAGSKKGSV